ncbi:MAG: lysylphosphatidylglycerol synthase transmembrane domain-containing protein [Acidobacteriota bacterium]
MKRILKVSIGLGVAALLLWLFFGGTDPETVWEALSEAKVGWLLGVLVFTLLHYVVRAWRWRLLLAPLRRRVPMRSLVEAILGGYAVSFLVPGRLGEVYRPVRLARQEGLSLAGALSTVALDRLLDALALALLVLFFLLTAPVGGLSSLPEVHARSLRHAGLLTGVGLAVVMPGIWLLVRFRRKLLGTPGAERTGWRKHLDPFLDGLSGLQRPRRAIRAVLSSILIWMVLSSQAWCGLKAFSIDLPFSAAFILIAFLALGIAVPLPAGVGGFHYLGRFCLVELFGVAAGPAVTAILILHFLAVLPAMILGGWILGREGASLAEISSWVKKKRVPSVPAAGQQKTGPQVGLSRGSS